MPDYSPSIYHRLLLDAAPPSLTFKVGDDFFAWREALRRKLTELLGLPSKRPVPLNVRSFWKREVPDGSIEKIQFTAEPGADVPAYVCLPKSGVAPQTWAICVQGHSTGMHKSIAVDREDNTKPIVVEGDRDFGLGCIKRGVAALCLEQRAFGERRELALPKPGPRGCHGPSMHALMLGRTLLGERVFDVDRALDYLETRDDVNWNRVGIMGNSGGGTTSLFSAALLDRLRYAMPSCYFCTFRDSLMSIFHCECNYVPGLMKYAEMADVMGLFAPKPVVIVAGETDEIFPIAAVKTAFTQLQEIYAAAGAPNRCCLVVGQGGHRFYADDAWPVALDELTRL
jgi:dienelactone hydrolase